ncbi:MAG: 50S ribosomal protein L2 [Candidatus Paceibacterota bacterium]
MGATTPGQRHKRNPNFDKLTDKEPEKELTIPLKKSGGRASSGKISVRGKGGGEKRKYRKINFGQKKKGVTGEVKALEYDPNRTAFIALVEYEDDDKCYLLATQDMKEGDEVICAEEAPLESGNRMKLKNIPPGNMVHNIELQPGRGGKLVRSAGSAAKVLAQEGKYTHLEMPSTEIRKVLKECYASVGEVSNQEHRYVKSGKAGRSRHQGKRPTTRGTAKNPVDHPHGGGEGRTGVGIKHPKTPWGKIAHGKKTRNRNHTDKYIIKRRNE